MRLTFIRALTAVSLACLGAMQGCQTAPTMLATAEDKALVEKFDALAPKYEGTYAQETLNHTREPEAQKQRKQLLGQLPATKDEIGGARWYYGRTVRTLENMPTWPKPLTVEIVKTSAAITIDGKGDEPAWQKAPAIPIPFIAGTKDRKPDPVAACRLMWDAKYLYAHYVVPPSDIVAPKLERDKDVWAYDCVELFLLGDKRFGVYWELNVSPSLAIFDQLSTKYQKNWYSYNRLDENIEGLKAAVVIDEPLDPAKPNERGYRVELAVPWDQVPSMTAGPQVGAKMFGIVAWSDVNGEGKNKTQAYYSSTPQLAWFHNIWCYSEWVFVGEK